jgi:hypothetical protein
MLAREFAQSDKVVCLCSGRRWQTVLSPATMLPARRQGSGSQPAPGHRVPPPVCVQRDPGSDYRAGVAS